MRPVVWNLGPVVCTAVLSAVSLAALAADRATLRVEAEAFASAGSQAQVQRPVFRSDVNFITVDAYPLVNGRVVEGLTAADFEVREDGRIQKVESFEFVRANERITEGQRQDPGNQRQMYEELADPRSRVFVAYLDVHNVGLPGAYYSRPAVVEMFQRILAPDDLVAMATSRNHPRHLTFGRTTRVVEEQLTRHWTWQDPDVTLNDAEESALLGCFGGDAPSLITEGGSELIRRRRQDQLFASLEGTVEYLGEVREGRKIMFLFSRGWTLFEPNDDLLKALNTPGRVPPKGPPVGPPPRMRPPGSSSEPAGNLGVRSSLYEGSRAACEQELIRLANMNNVLRFKQLMRDAAINNVAIYPVNPSGVGAIDGSNDRLMEMASNTGGTAVSNRNDLVKGVIDVSREFEAYYLLGYTSDNNKADGTLRRIDVRVNKPGVEVKARRGYRAMSQAEAESKAAADATPVTITAERAALDAALDLLAGIRVGDDRAFDLRRYLRPSLAPHLGAPVMSRATPSPRSPMVPITAPTFRRNERLHIEWPISQAIESRTARIVGRDGNPVGVQVVLTERAGPPAHLVADAILGPLGFGDYALELTITTSGTPRRALFAFRVVP